jgi:hypothetical protein
MASLDTLEPAEEPETGEIDVLGSCTPTVSLQRDRPDCMLHTLSKLLIKNVFEKVLDLKLSKDEETKYERCMPLLIPKKLSRMDEEKCSRKGYIKIMLFYYLFSLIESTDSRNIPEALALIKEMPFHGNYVPGRSKTYREVKILEEDKPLFREVKREFLAKSSAMDWKHIHIAMDDVPFEPIKGAVLEPILRLNLYIEMGLEEELTEEEYDEDKEPGRHIVLVTGFDEENIHIKNTWDYKVTIKVPWGESIPLDDGKQWKITDLHLLLPVKGRVTGSEYDGRNIDELFPFLADYRLPVLGGKTRRFRSKKHKSYRYRS